MFMWWIIVAAGLTISNFLSKFTLLYDACYFLHVQLIVVTSFSSTLA